MYSEICRYVDEILKENRYSKRVDLVIIDISDLYCLRPSLFKVFSKPVSELFGIIDEEYHVVTDVVIMKLLIGSFVEDYSFDNKNIISIITDYLSSHFKLILNTDDDLHLLLNTYLETFKLRVGNLLRPYIASYPPINPMTPLEEIYKLDKFYNLFYVDIEFNMKGVNMKLMIKLYNEHLQ